MQELYKEIVLDHFRRPRNRGEMEDADLEERVFNPLCGDAVTVYADLRDGKRAGWRSPGGAAPSRRRRPRCLPSASKARAAR
ncbi:MAG: hypothetical protein CYG60_09205, partial [Actinobacteria bacterium]